MDEIIKCGDFSISDFLKDKASLDDLENKEKRVQMMIEDGFEKGQRGIIRKAGERIAKTRYYTMDMKFLNINESVLVGKSKISVPRFGTIDLDKDLTTRISLEYTNMFANPDRGIEIEITGAPDNIDITKSIFHCITGEACYIDYNDRSFQRHNGYYRKNLLERMHKSGIAKIKSYLRCDIECVADFYLTDKASDEIAKSKKYLDGFQYSMIIDNHLDGWNINYSNSDFHSLSTPVHETDDKGLVVKSTKKHHDVLIMASHLNKHYLITTFDPVYENIPKGDIDG